MTILNSGTVTELDTKLGERVSAGDVLAKIGNSTSVEANIAQYELEVLNAQQALQSLYQNANMALAQAYQDWVTAKQAYEDAQIAKQRTNSARCSKEVNTSNGQFGQLSQIWLNSWHILCYNAIRKNFLSSLYPDRVCVPSKSGERLGRAGTPSRSTIEGGPRQPAWNILRS